MLATLAGTPCLSRLKSIARYLRLWPPPRHQEVSWPWLLRPPLDDLPLVSALCGRSVVSSSNVRCVWNRLDALIGFLSLIGIAYIPSKNSICFSPATRRTQAFFQSGRRPE
jgi:hypothetical protein